MQPYCNFTHLTFNLKLEVEQKEEERETLKLKWRFSFLSAFSSSNTLLNLNQVTHFFIELNNIYYLFKFFFILALVDDIEKTITSLNKLVCKLKYTISESHNISWNDGHNFSWGTRWQFEGSR